MLGLTRWLSQPARRTPSRLRLEHLEAREVPAVFVVTNTNDSGAGSLRDAIAQANNESANPGADTIRFDPSLYGTNIFLSTVGDTTVGPTALGITSDITIDGFSDYAGSVGGMSLMFDNTNVPNLRAFYVASSGSLTLDGLNVVGFSVVGAAGGDSNGSGGGGGGAGLGGAIYNRGTLTVSRSALWNNTATGGTGGSGATGSSGNGGNGGGTNGGLGSNGSAGFVGGAGGFGGGGGGGYLDNSAAGAGGAGGFGGGGGGGGASPGSVGVGGTSGFGGGTGGGGGGAGGGGGGGAGMGGALFNDSGTVVIANSTFFSNTATGGAGGSGTNAGGNGDGIGGAIFNLNGSVSVVSSTVSGNLATFAGGIGSYASDMSGGVSNANPATLTLANSILYGNTTNGGPNDVRIDQAASGSGGASLTATSPNILGVYATGSGTANTSGVITSDPQLASAGDNGGTVKTFAITSSSPAHGAGSVTDTAGLATDARGMRRVVAGAVDLGAYQLDTTGATAGVATVGATTTNAASVTFTVTFDKPVYGVTTASFATVAGGGLTGTSVIGVTGSGTTYTVTVSTGTGDGTVGLSVLGTGSAADYAGNHPTVTTGPAYTIDRVAPAVVSINRADADPTSNQNVAFVVTFSKAVTGVDASDFALTYTGAAAGGSVTSVNGSGTTWTVTVDTGTGDGTVRLDLNASGTGIQDVVGNAIATGFTGGEAYTIDHSVVSQTTTPTTSPELAVPTSLTVTTPGSSPTGTAIKVFDPQTGQNTRTLIPFVGYSGAVDVTLRDLNGDGVPDAVVGAGANGGPRVAVFDGASGNMIASFFAFDPGFTGGVSVAAGDVTGDGVADIVVGAGAGGGPNIRVFDGRTFTLVASFFAYSQSFLGGVNVATGDVTGDGKADIVVGPGAGGGPEVKVFSGADLSVAFDFLAYDQSFLGGVSVAAGDVNGDGFADIITGAGAGGGSNIRVFSGKDGSPLGSFQAFDSQFTGGVSVGVTDANGNGMADIAVGAGPGGGPNVRVFDGRSFGLISSTYAFGADLTGGTSVS